MSIKLFEYLKSTPKFFIINNLYLYISFTNLTPFLMKLNTIFQRSLSSMRSIRYYLSSTLFSHQSLLLTLLISILIIDSFLSIIVIFIIIFNFFIISTLLILVHSMFIPLIVTIVTKGHTAETYEIAEDNPQYDLIYLSLLSYRELGN